MPVNRKGQPRAEREAAVIEVAERLFLERGFHQTAVFDIAKALALTSNAVTWYFPTKDDLLAAVLRRWTTQTVTALQVPGRDFGPTSLGEALEAFRPYRQVYAVVHERMHRSEAVHAWHEQSRELLGMLAGPLLERVCPDDAHRGRVLPILVDLIDINLLHHQEDDRPTTLLLDSILDSLLVGLPALPSSGGA